MFPFFFLFHCLLTSSSAFYSTPSTFSLLFSLCSFWKMYLKTHRENLSFSHSLLLFSAGVVELRLLILLYSLQFLLDPQTALSFPVLLQYHHIFSTKLNMKSKKNIAKSVVSWTKKLVFLLLLWLLLHTLFLNSTSSLSSSFWCSFLLKTPFVVVWHILEHRRNFMFSLGCSLSLSFTHSHYPFQFTFHRILFAKKSF